MEPEITINGQKVTTAMAMTIRVAVESFALSLACDGIGDDESGKDMSRLYMARITEIRKLMYSAELTGR